MHSIDTVEVGDQPGSPTVHTRSLQGPQQSLVGADSSAGSEGFGLESEGQGSGGAEGGVKGSGVARGALA